MPMNSFFLRGVISSVSSSGTYEKDGDMYGFLLMTDDRLKSKEQYTIQGLRKKEL
jgi:hypothetical protein